jgi:signal transduction histidine kinase
MADVPGGLPPHVVEAVRGAVGEALTNAHRHAGTAEAWVTAVGLDRRLRVTVVDRGAGFAQDTVDGRRFGVRESIVGRMAAAGGRTAITSQPHAGTCVELSWPG